MSEMPTRAKVWEKICVRHAGADERRGAWVTTNVIAAIPDDEWATDHRGVCQYCGASARLYASGWRCDGHLPGSES